MMYLLFAQQKQVLVRADQSGSADAASPDSYWIPGRGSN